MSAANTNGLSEIGRKLWLVNFMTSYISDTGTTFEEEGGSDEVHQVWADAIYENYKMLKEAVDELKGAILLLGPEQASVVAAAYHQEDEESKARGAATCMLENIQREISEKKGGAQ